ncbi:MAG: hypothetical protein RLO50_09975 [Azospirillaceae bacterium]
MTIRAGTPAARLCRQLPILGLLALLAAPAGAADMPTRADLVGTWQFMPRPCASGYGMGLSDDGTAWLLEGYNGTWDYEDGEVTFTVVEYELGLGKPVTGEVERFTMEITAYHGDRFDFAWDAGDENTAWRCPDG